jgi:hypothetical protein
MFQQPMGMYAQGQMGFQGQGSYSPMGGFRPKGPGFRGRMAKLKSMCKPAERRSIVITMHYVIVGRVWFIFQNTSQAACPI